MPKLIDKEIAALKIIDAKFSNGKWFVLLSDSNNYLYSVSFSGGTDSSDAYILNNTYSALLQVDKHPIIVEAKAVTKTSVIGLPPKA